MARAGQGAAAVCLRELVGPAATVLYAAIRGVVSDAVLRVSERCPDSGFELRRRLFSEMRGAAPQIAMARAEQFQFPQRAPNTDALRAYLDRRDRPGCCHVPRRDAAR